MKGLKVNLCLSLCQAILGIYLKEAAQYGD